MRWPWPPDFRVGVLIGAVLFSFGLGSILAMWLLPGTHNYWPAPLPVTFIGGGLIFAFAAISRLDSEY